MDRIELAQQVEFLDDKKAERIMDAQDMMQEQSDRMQDGE